MRARKRQRFFRYVVVELECGCEERINTGRYRVSQDVLGLTLGHAARKGIWCFKHGGTCQIVKYLRVERE
jgi:hypothetical protein